MGDLLGAAAVVGVAFWAAAATAHMAARYFGLAVPRAWVRRSVRALGPAGALLAAILVLAERDLAAPVLAGVAVYVATAGGALLGWHAVEDRAQRALADELSMPPSDHTPR